MKYSYLTNNRGVTLVELIVALALSSMLLIFVVSGSLFVQDFLKERKSRDNLFEELAFVSGEIATCVSSSRFVSPYADSLMCISSLNEATTYAWHDGQVFENDRALLRSGVHLDTMAIMRLDLPKYADSTILNKEQQGIPLGLYEIYLVASDERNLTDSIRRVVKNEYIVIKYLQK
ncbi:MAG: prepilin-type N-terminal cleavage/methylation domain-containing protein [Candidatus Zixiibacteriota bacterium]